MQKKHNFAFLRVIFMKISAVQFSPILFEKSLNIEYITTQIKKINSDLIVFPELATTGYFFLSKDEVKKYAEPFDGETRQIIQKLSTELNKAVVYGFPEEKDGHFYNSAAIIFPDSKYSRVYRKIHLFFKEKFVFTEGDLGFFNIHYPDWDLNLGTMVCYDWRFPEAARTLALNGADLIVAPSNLITKIWHHSMPSRALDNHIFLVVANRIGTETRREEELNFNGMSVIYNYYGEVLNLAGPNEESVITAEIDPKEARDKAINAFNDIIMDRRPQYYFLG